MEIRFHAHHIEKSDMFEERITTALNELNDKYLQQVDTASVTVQKQGAEFVVNVKMRHGGKLLVQGHGNNVSAYIALDSCLERVAKQLRRYKRQLRNMKPRGAKDIILRAPHRIITPFVDEAMDEAANAAAAMPATTGVSTHDDDSALDAALPPNVVAEHNVDIEVMTVQEAVMQMDLLSVHAIMFQNAASSAIDMVYYRQDGQIGWVSGPAVAA
ncbi:MAG: HPF/RaiA family ribosome-associated protein [Alphaproteobacteria bacterium]|nr:HPF/RaiA family ribosome-associated protein [Alphaproteobacteria bacterium]